MAEKKCLTEKLKQIFLYLEKIKKNAENKDIVNIEIIDFEDRF